MDSTQIFIDMLQKKYVDAHMNIITENRNSFFADYKSKYKVGIINNFNAYVMNKLKDSEREIDGNFLDDYFIKSPYDFSAQDCAHMALRRVGIPPIELMSVESLEKTIREVFDEYNDEVYIKMSKKMRKQCALVGKLRALFQNIQL